MGYFKYWRLGVMGFCFFPCGWHTSSLLFVIAFAHTRVVVFVANSGWMVHCRFDL